MPRRKRKPRLCFNEADSGCDISSSSRPSQKTGRTNRKIYELFDEQGVVVDRDEQDRFVDFLERSERQRDVVKQLWTRLKDDDIISLILSARDADDLDEGIWRSFDWWNEAQSMWLMRRRSPSTPSGRSATVDALEAV